MEIKETMKAIHANAREKGFFEKEKNIAEMLCLIHSEVSEALEADRNDEYYEDNVNVLNGWVSDDDFHKHYKLDAKGTFEEEMADIMIRVMDLCEFKKIDLEGHIQAKMRYNSMREKYHGKKY